MSLDSYNSVKAAAKLAGINISGLEPKDVEKSVLSAAKKLRTPQAKTGFRPILPAANSTPLMEAVVRIALHRV